MALGEFLQNLRNAASFVFPNVHADGDERKNREWLRILRSATIWLTPAAVKGFRPADFYGLPSDTLEELKQRVSRFKAIAANVPSKQPATEQQINAALPELLRIVEILEANLGPEAVRAQRLLEDVDWPAYVLGFFCESAEAWDGEPMLRIWIVVTDEVANRQDFFPMSLDLERKVQEILQRNGIELDHGASPNRVRKQDVLFAHEMTLHADLLDQARFLVRREPKRPRQTSLRRAVSAAYYALFHLLVHESANMLVADRELRRLVGRAFDHAEMKQASRAFAAKSLPLSLQPFSPVPNELALVAATFIQLQEMRHEADYDIGRRFFRAEALGLVNRVEHAFSSWSAVRQQPAARAYLASLLLHKRWSR